VLPASPQHDQRTAPRRAAAAIAVAVALLTVIPAWPLTRHADDDDLRAARFAFPLVGIALGLIIAALSALLQRAAAPPQVAAVLLVAALAALTGGLHLDGLADAADGLFLWGDPARRLAAMRDPHVGSYGVAALVLVLLAKCAALASLAGHSRPLGLLGAVAVSRALLLVSAGCAPYARSEGTGRATIEATTRRDALAAGGFVLAAAGLLGHAAGLLAALLALGLTLALTALANRRLGGITGDVLGAVAELGETGYLVCLCCG
jgi:adenosylcobinamide-GDP ribazoletransferase